jgi:hypothetical protein
MYVFGENMVKNDEDDEEMERFKFDQIWEGSGCMSSKKHL